MLEDVYEELRKKMTKSLAKLEKELGGVRTGRASATLIEDIRVTYYGVPTPINQLATLSVPESRLITIQPWDKSVLREIEKAISHSDLGLNPTSDGNIIRIPFPTLTEERRKELVRLVKKIGEEYKIAIRNVRRDGNEEVKEMEKEGLISEDASKKGQKEIQKITDEFIKKVDELVAKKETEIMEF